MTPDNLYQGPFHLKTNPPSPIQPVSERFPALEEQEVVFTFLAPEAGEVNVAGNFNGWRPEATLLKNTGAGEWVARLRFRSGQYEYRFVVDGQWREDPRASQRVANPYGGFNSVLLVPLDVRTSIL
jgi:1,4-alpha-glucan branching enzyme